MIDQSTRLRSRYPSDQAGNPEAEPDTAINTTHPALFGSALAAPCDGRSLLPPEQQPEEKPVSRRAIQQHKACREESCQQYHALMEKVRDPSISEESRQAAYANLKAYIDTLPVTLLGRNLPAWTNCVEDEDGDLVNHDVHEDDRGDLYCNPEYTQAYASLGKPDYKALSKATAQNYDGDDSQASDLDNLYDRMGDFREAELDNFINQLECQRQPARLVIDYRFHPEVAGVLAHKLLETLNERNTPVAEMTVQPTWYNYGTFDLCEAEGEARSLMSLINDFDGYKLSLGGKGYSKHIGHLFFKVLPDIVRKERKKDKSQRLLSLDLSMLPLISSPEFHGNDTSAAKALAASKFFLEENNYWEVSKP